MNQIVIALIDIRFCVSPFVHSMRIKYYLHPAVLWAPGFGKAQGAKS